MGGVIDSEERNNLYKMIDEPDNRKKRKKT